MQKRKPEEQPLAPDLPKNAPKPKDRLKDLDVTHEDGSVVKGGVPKDVDPG